MPAAKPKVECICQNCGLHFWVQPYDADRKYCSRPCHDVGRKVQPNVKNSKPKIELTCQQCGQAFVVFPYRANAHYCSRKCKDVAMTHNTGENSPNWQGGPVPKICLNCGSEYIVGKAQAVESKFCSKSCHSSYTNRGERSLWWKGGPVVLTCPQCHNTFQANRDDQRRRYCSRRCHDEARKNRIILTCMACGKQYEEKASKANRYERSFCSLECRDSFKIGPMTPGWRGGISFEPYPPMFNDQFKRMIRKRDNHICAICGKRAKCVHHINYVKDDTTPENCITLCRSCHGKTNANREYWQEFFSNLLPPVKT